MRCRVHSLMKSNKKAKKKKQTHTGTYEYMKIIIKLLMKNAQYWFLMHWLGYCLRWQKGRKLAGRRGLAGGLRSKNIDRTERNDCDLL